MDYRNQYLSMLFCIMIFSFFGCEGGQKRNDIANTVERRPEKQKTNAINARSEASPDIDIGQGDDLAATLQKMLEKFKDKIPGKSYRITIGNFVLKDSEISSSFADNLAEEISVAISNCDFLEEYPRKQFDNILRQHKLSISNFIDPTTRPKMGMLKAVQGILQGGYSRYGERIKIYLHLLDMETGRKLGAASGTISCLDIQGELQPANFEQTVEALKIFTSSEKNGFSVRVWVDKGKSATYKIGEKLKVCFQAERDCYLKLYHISAEGDVQLIYPYGEDSNEIKAGRIYRIPDDEDEFEFKLKRPLGTEIIKAIASTTQFDHMEKVGQILGQANERGKLKKIAQRGMEVRKKQKIAEDSCVYTIIEGSRGL